MTVAKAQVSMEYMIITGFILVAILIPAFILLFSTTNKSVYGTVNLQKVEDLNKGLLNDAKQMYYLGLYSNKIVDYEIPRNVENFYILELTKMNGGVVEEQEYYLGISIRKGAEIHTMNFPSDVPITSEAISGVVEVETEADNNLVNLISVCAQTDIDCKFYNFVGRTIAPGKKQFKVETVYDNVNSIIISKIYPIS